MIRLPFKLRFDKNASSPLQMQTHKAGLDFRRSNKTQYRYFDIEFSFGQRRFEPLPALVGNNRVYRGSGC